jgi:thioredoxin 1
MKEPTMARVFDAPIITNDQSFERLLDAQIPVLFLFWQGGSLPDSINQAMIRLADEQAGKLIVAKINTQENPAAARHFGVQRPLVLIGMEDGQELTRVNQPTAEDIEQHAQFVLGKGPRPAARRAATPRGGNGSAKNGGNGGNGSHPVPVTDATFEQMVLHSEIPVIVDFWAPWCGPCHALAPTLDKLARDFAGRVRIAKVNVDQNPHYAGMYSVQGIPTLLLIKDGKVVDRLVGVTPEPHLRARVEHML